VGSISSVFRNWKYYLLTAVITIVMGITLSYLYQMIFFSPYFTVYVPSSSYSDLLYVVTVSILSGTTISLNMSRLFRNRSSGIGFTGSGLALLSGICSCTAFILVSFSGGVLGIVAAFFTIYESQVRIISIVLLLISIYFIYRK